MRTAWIWLVLAVPAGWAIWQLRVTEPVVPPPYLGLVLLILGVFAGLRLATDGLHRLLQDLIQANRELAGQLDQLAEENSHLHEQRQVNPPQLPHPLGEDDPT